jgi:hypothetical protein
MGFTIHILLYTIHTIYLHVCHLQGLQLEIPVLPLPGQLLRVAGQRAVPLLHVHNLRVLVEVPVGVAVRGGVCIV